MEKWKTDGAPNMVLFSNKYKELCFVLPDTGHVYYFCEEDIVFRQHYGWVIYAQCDVQGVAEDKVTDFLAVTLIIKTPQADCVKVLHPKKVVMSNKSGIPMKSKNTCFYAYRLLFT